MESLAELFVSGSARTYGESATSIEDDTAVTWARKGERRLEATVVVVDGEVEFLLKAVESSIGVSSSPTSFPLSPSGLMMMIDSVSDGSGRPMLEVSSPISVEDDDTRELAPSVGITELYWVVIVVSGLLPASSAMAGQTVASLDE
ncbi:hypothetical protein FRB91_009546 [Serendipita sp. 411]|nr:hypothetical protein FRB91_009546 [Serendipita sp. 411]